MRSQDAGSTDKRLCLCDSWDFLGLLITVAWAPYLDNNTHPVAIILKTTFLCAFIGFLFPNQIQGLFTWVWKFFSH